MGARGATAVDDPAGALDVLREQRDLPLPHIDAARRHAEIELARVRNALAETPTHDGVGTVVFGSWARGELTDGSDHDWAVLVAGPVDESIAAAELDIAQQHLGEGERTPGPQGTFAASIAVDDLAENIGLDRDTNTNLTRRMLLLLESRELHGAARDTAIADILERYLNEGAKPGRVPRFLLNDIVRYWRTICVDFEGKAAKTGGAVDAKWATRNAKLRTSRKLLFVGGLVSALLCEPAGGRIADMQAFLTRWLDAAPLDRLAGAFLYAADARQEMLDPAVRTFVAYDRWLELIGDTDKRRELLEITPEGRDDSALFQTVREIGEDFESGLLSLLFSPAFEDLTRSYAIF